jgi:DtxR family Mn-dependent transcriptional regulator
MMVEIKLSESVQNYLKVIYKLETEKNEATTSEIAYELNISSASVTGMLKRLASMKLVNYSSYKGVSLTDDGYKIALEVLRHHRLLEAYLRDSMGFQLARLHDEACKLEHYVSDEFIEKVTAILGDPDFSPLGHPIPRRDGEIPLQDNISLIDLKPVISGVISSIDTRNNELINYLDQIGLIPGKKITLHEIAPFYGPIVINLEGNNLSIGYEVAKILKIDKSTIEYS